MPGSGTLRTGPEPVPEGHAGHRHPGGERRRMSGTGVLAATGSRLPVPKRDRRPALAALAVLLILAGALGSALIAYRSGDRVDVLVASDDILPGQKIDADD